MPEIPKLMIRIEFAKPDGTYFVGYAVYDTIEETMEKHKAVLDEGATYEMTIVEIPERIRLAFEKAQPAKKLPFH